MRMLLARTAGASTTSTLATRIGSSIAASTNTNTMATRRKLVQLALLSSLGSSAQAASFISGAAPSVGFVRPISTTRVRACVPFSVGRVLGLVGGVGFDGEVWMEGGQAGAESRVDRSID